MWKLPQSYLDLSGYAEFTTMSESAVMGITRQTDSPIGCSNAYWDQSDRMTMSNAIRQAESMMVTHLKYPMKETYFCQERYQHRKYTNIVNMHSPCIYNLRRHNVISLGAKVEEVVQLGVATGVAVTNEEYTLTVPVSFIECKELVIYYPGQTRWEIKPSRVSISGGVASITIPRPRLLKTEYFIDFSDVADRPRFEDASFFLTTVDVYHRFADSAQAATYVWYRKACGCKSSVNCLHSASNPGSVVTQNGTGVIIDSRLGIIQLEPATLDVVTGDMQSVSWSQCYPPDYVLISYVAGLNEDCDGNCPEETDPELVRAIIALAHSTLSQPICSCDPVSLLYLQDYETPKPNEGPTILSPFGTSNGQNLAWRTVKRRSAGMGGLLNG